MGRSRLEDGRGGDAEGVDVSEPVAMVTGGAEITESSGAEDATTGAAEMTGSWTYEVNPSE